MKKFVILISADAEWEYIKTKYPSEKYQYQESPYGKWFDLTEDIVYFHGGWGKVAAAGSTQYIIDKFQTSLIINIGTCGGFEGEITKYAIVLPTETIIYDIYEKMGDAQEAIDHYKVDLQTQKWETIFKDKVIPTPMISADRDLKVRQINELKEKYHARVADWESGAIAFVCQRNDTELLILRGVSDLVSEEKGDVYNNLELYQKETKKVMASLDDLIKHIL